MLTWVQVWGAEVHQLLTGPSWGKNKVEAGEKLPPPCSWWLTQQKPLADSEAGPQPFCPQERALASPWTLNAAYLHTAGGTGRCSCPRHPHRCPHWHMRAPHSHLCSPDRLVLQSQWDKSTCKGRGGAGWVPHGQGSSLPEILVEACGRWSISLPGVLVPTSGQALARCYVRGEQEDLPLTVK